MIFISNKDNNLINNKISNLIKSKNIQDFTRFDFNYSQREELISELEQVSLFDETKIFVLNLDGYLKTRIATIVIEELLKQLKSLETESRIIIVIDNTELRFLDHIINPFFNEFFVLQEINNKNKMSIIKEIAKNNNLILNEMQLNLLDQKLPKNVDIISNEIIKLNNSNLNNIDEIICDYNEYEIFNIVNYYFNKDYKNLFTLLDKVYKDNDACFFLFNYMTTKVLNLYLIKKALLVNWDADKIASTYNMNKFAVINDIKLLRTIGIKDIEILLYNLYHIEKVSRTYYSDFKTLLKLLFLDVRIS